jgi:hypothetical protein
MRYQLSRDPLSLVSGRRTFPKAARLMGALPYSKCAVVTGYGLPVAWADSSSESSSSESSSTSSPESNSNEPAEAATPAAECGKSAHAAVESTGTSAPVSKVDAVEVKVDAAEANVDADPPHSDNVAVRWAISDVPDCAQEGAAGRAPPLRALFHRLGDFLHADLAHRLAQ